MWSKELSVNYINSHVAPKSQGQCAAYVRRAIEAGGVKVNIPAPRIGNSASACDYGVSLETAGFKSVYTYTGHISVDTAIIPGQQAGDVVVIQPIQGHPHGHIALFNGNNWVSDFVQLRGFYPGQQYRTLKPAFVMYRFGAEDQSQSQTTPDNNQEIKIYYPITKKNGSEFTQQDDILTHLAGEPTGLFLVGRNGMWHSGIHITQVTTPWCALSGKAVSEHIDFPAAYKGEQAVCCMADGEVVAYRICREYLDVPWETGPLLFSGSFVLVRHYIQPGETEKSGLHFYTLYMHLAPYSAYEVTQDKPLWTVQNALSVYHPDWLMVAPTHNPGSVNSSYRAGTIPKGAIVEWDESDNNLHVMGFNHRKYGLVTFQGLNEEAQKNNVKTSLKSGQQCWMLVDHHNIVPGTGSVVRPAWWRALMPPAKECMIFDQVVCPEPFAIHAGEPVGHLGYYQAPKDGSYVSRYQVHIECFSMDENLPQFLSNPEKVGAEHPLWLKYSPGLELYGKNIRTGTFAKDGRVTSRSGLLKLSDLRAETDATTKEEYWHLPPENGYVPKGQAQPELLSQYDLGKLGFRTEIVEPPSFDYLDGKTQPAGLVRRLFEWMLEAAKNDPRPSHAMAKHGYQYLLNKIDSEEPYYSSGEYLRAIHRQDYRDVVQKTIVKHPSDWYHKKGDAIWQSFLEPLKKEAPEWKAYGEAFIDKMSWMQDVTTEKLGPSPWHMHPIVFLGALQERNKLIWIKMVENRFGSDTAELFKQKVISVGRELSIDPNYIMACMALETGEKFNTSTKNPHSSATGLIQFMADTAEDLGTTTEKLAAMTHVEQMDYVKRYFEMQANNFDYPTSQWSLGDVYLSIFTPAAMLLKDTDVVYRKGQRAYAVNLFHDRNKDGKITKGEIVKNIDEFYEKGFSYEG